jgi:hypothetical protein
VLDRVAAGDAHLPARVRQIVRTVRPRLAADRLDLRLVRCARGLPGFAELLGEWLCEDPAAEAGPRTRRLRELVADGMPAQRAARIAEAMPGSDARPGSDNRPGGDALRGRDAWPGREVARRGPGSGGPETAAR